MNVFKEAIDLDDVYYNRITELLKDRVKLSNIKPETHNAIDWISLSNNPNAISILEKNVVIYIFHYYFGLFLNYDHHPY